MATAGANMNLTSGQARTANARNDSQKVLRHHDTVAGPGGIISNGFKPSS